MILLVSLGFTAFFACLVISMAIKSQGKDSDLAQEWLVVPNTMVCLVAFVLLFVRALDTTVNENKPPPKPPTTLEIPK